jgi:uncharacterized Ntn-hydrolase superfamily protein
MFRVGSWLLLGSLAATGGGEPPPVVATFSIVAFDKEAGEWGVAVQSKFFGVGAVVPYARAGVGAIATQARANPTYGPEGLERLRGGASAEDVVKQLVGQDPDRDVRQLGVVDAQGRASAWTGAKCMAWAGHVTGEGFTCQGNILAGEPVVQDMARAFQESKGPLAERLLLALEAGQKAGGDKRGMQSAAIVVVRAGGGYGGKNDRFLDLRVEDHAEPIAELRRLVGLHRRTFRSSWRPAGEPEGKR